MNVVGLCVMDKSRLCPVSAVVLSNFRLRVGITHAHPAVLPVWLGLEVHMQIMQQVIRSLDCISL